MKQLLQLGVVRQHLERIDADVEEAQQLATQGLLDAEAFGFFIKKFQDKVDGLQELASKMNGDKATFFNKEEIVAMAEAVRLFAMQEYGDIYPLLYRKNVFKDTDLRRLNSLCSVLAHKIKRLLQLRVEDL